MVRGVKKEHLPEKVCVVCHRPFTWRKKWESCWDDVTTCSKSCNRKRRASQQEANRAARTVSEQTKDFGEEERPRSSGIGVVVEDDDASEALDDTSVDGDNTAARLSILDFNSADNPSNESIALSSGGEETSVDEPRAARKLAKQQRKAQRRLQRQGLAPHHGQKPCQVCNSNADLLIRCTVDASNEWKMVCGKCWPSVSGGVVDGDEDHPHYRYGGLWKNRARRS